MQRLCRVRTFLGAWLLLQREHNFLSDCPQSNPWRKLLSYCKCISRIYAHCPSPMQVDYHFGLLEVELWKLKFGQRLTSHPCVVLP